MIKCVIHTTNMKDWLARFGHILGSFAIECSICAQKKNTTNMISIQSSLLNSMHVELEGLFILRSPSFLQGMLQSLQMDVWM
jgi:hypothetical protein